MKIHLIPRQFQLTNAIENFTAEKLAALEEIACDVQSADVVLAHDVGVNRARRFTASVRLALPGKDVHASDTGPDLYVAIGSVQRKLARRLRKRKARFAVRRQKLQRAIEHLRQWGATPIHHAIG